MQLRPYQDKLVNDCRMEFRQHNRVFMQLATGGGKTVIVSQMAKNAYERKFRVWFIVPRNELMKQSSEHFYKWKIPHGMIKAGMNESRAYMVHLISKDTLMRRIKKGVIKNWPEFCIFDEAHVAIDQQKTIISNFPEKTKVLAISATPERTDGRGLSDIYQSIVYGPSIKDLIEMHYLANFRYFCPPLEGIEELHKTGTDVKADELEALLNRRAVYGKAIDHYRKYADKQPCIVFCRNIKAAEETAQKFREAGYRFESIDGRMSDKKRQTILDGVRDGKLHGVTSVDLCIYGLDIPRLTVAIMLRPTSSVAVFYQQIGRILRPGDGKMAIILDHVNNLHTHGHPLQDYDWKFYGKEKRKSKGKSTDILKLCSLCYMYFAGTSCPNCGNIKPPRKANGLVEVDGRLIEHKGPITLKDRPVEEQKEFHDKIADAKQRYDDAAALGDIDTGVVRELLELAEELGRAVMWVYHTLNTAEHVVNVPLLTAIAHEKEYKYYWVKIKRQELQKRNVKRSLL